MVVADIDGEAASAVAQEIGGMGVRCDVTREDDLRALLDRTGPVDVFANAGIAAGSDKQTPTRSGTAHSQSTCAPTCLPPACWCLDG